VVIRDIQELVTATATAAADGHGQEVGKKSGGKPLISGAAGKKASSKSKKSGNKTGSPSTAAQTAAATATATATAAIEDDKKPSTDLSCYAIRLSLNGRVLGYLGDFSNPLLRSKFLSHFPNTAPAAAAPAAAAAAAARSGPFFTPTAAAADPPQQILANAPLSCSIKLPIGMPILSCVLQLEIISFRDFMPYQAMSMPMSMSAVEDGESASRGGVKPPYVLGSVVLLGDQILSSLQPFSSNNGIRPDIAFTSLPIGNKKKGKTGTISLALLRSTSSSQPTAPAPVPASAGLSSSFSSDKLESTGSLLVDSVRMSRDHPMTAAAIDTGPHIHLHITGLEGHTPAKTKGNPICLFRCKV
jgi:hypothetical protein